MIRSASTATATVGDASNTCGLPKAAREGLSLAGQTVVFVIRGSGLTDAETAMKAKADLIELPADLPAIEKAMGWPSR